MKRALTSALAVSLSAGTAMAGGLDRSGQGINIIFEEGNVIQANIAYTTPNVSGSTEYLGLSNSGDIANSFVTPHLAYKHSFSDNLDVAIIYDRPFGADVDYSSTYLLSRLGPGNLSAKADVDALTALVRYKFDNNISLIGGLRGQRTKATVNVPITGGYNVKTNAPIDFGYVVGAAWEKPEIAARVSLTYNSAITHNFNQTETLATAGIVEDTMSQIKTPQSVNLDFQTGVAPKTLLFGTVRWVNWSDVVYDPPNYPQPTPLVSYADDTITYSLGLGRQITDQFSGAFVLGYEPTTGSTQSNLGPTDGFFSVGLAGTYQMENAKLSGGVPRRQPPA